jgi:DNA-binding LacI/PurR family transcriptional regulator
MSGDPTIYDIAARAGVGIATVSRVLNAHPRVKEETRDAVLKACADLGFRPNRAARRLAAGGPNRPRVAALAPLFATAFAYGVTRPLAAGLAAAGIDLVLYDIPDRETKQRTLDRLLGERACEGLVLCSMGIGAERAAQFAAARIPVVAVDHPCDGLPAATIDNRAAMRLAVTTLQERGARRIAHLAGGDALAYRERRAGFVATAGTAAPVVAAETPTREGGAAACGILLDAHPDIDAIACASDAIAVGALEECRRRGLAAPARIQVMGFDDQPFMDVIGLSTVRQPVAGFGAWAAQAVAALCADPAASVASVQLPVSVVERLTTRTPATPSRRRAR